VLPYHPYQHAPYVSGINHTTSQTAQPRHYGTGPNSIALGTRTGGSWTQRGMFSAPTGNGGTAAPAPSTTAATYARAVEPTIMEHRTAHKQKSLSGATTPYHHKAWQKHIMHHDLSAKYGYIPDSLQHGFDAGIPTITCTYTPPNHPSVTLYEEHFNNIISKEFAKG